MIVTGTQGDKPVRFSSKVSLKDAEAGQFVHPPALGADAPRPPARSKARRRRSRTRSSPCRKSITSSRLTRRYWCLESDADRERFKVKRGFQMRDGEKFFAEGRDNANFELVQQQMKRAGNWRIGLRRRRLAS